MSDLRINIRTDIPRDRIYIIEFYMKAYEDGDDFDDAVHFLEYYRVPRNINSDIGARLARIKDVDEGGYRIFVRLLDRRGNSITAETILIRMPDDDLAYRVQMREH